MLQQGTGVRLSKGQCAGLSEYSCAERRQLSNGISDRDDCEAVEGGSVDWRAGFRKDGNRARLLRQV